MTVQDAEPVLAPAPRWYVIHTVRYQEKLAASEIQAAGLTAYLPMAIKTNRKGETYGAPLFPNFLFTRLAIGSEGWTAVYRARGVAAVLGHGGRPSPVPTKIIEDIQWREKEGLIQFGLALAETTAAPVYRFKHGQRVRITKGPWATLEAIFMEAVDKRRCQLLIRLIGESYRIAEAAMAHIEVCASAEAPGVRTASPERLPTLVSSCADAIENLG